MELFLENKWISNKSQLKIELGLLQEQKAVLWSVFNKYALAFAFSKGDFGYCSICEYEIETNGFYMCRSHPNQLNEYEEDEVH